MKEKTSTEDDLGTSFAGMRDVVIRKALVTGGSRGIGRGIAKVLAAEGYDIAITYAGHREQAEAVAEEIRTRFGRVCIVIQASLERQDVPGAAVQTAFRALDGLDVLVNNAGITRFNEGIDEDVEMLNAVVDLDFKAYMLASSAAARLMVDHGVRGAIVNITSSRAERAYPEDAFYGAVKAAVKRATESLALKYAPHGIRVNCVAPGATVEPERQQAHPHLARLASRIPLGRIGTPEDVGQAVAWLVSDKASYVTGITLRVDGGLILPGMPEHDPSGMAPGWGARARQQDNPST